MPKVTTSLRKSLRVAIRHADAPTTTPDEREAILTIAANTYTGPSGEEASRSLHHLREQRNHLSKLRSILDSEK